MVYRSVSYVPGLYKIFDEILVNAADNKQRDPKIADIECGSANIETKRKQVERRERYGELNFTDVCS
ncbi:hypothetical protein C5167_007797 [Papaver somniferum]|nr:hypothetical protein C5167_007797 [Papaver somniferum]